MQTPILKYPLGEEIKKGDRVTFGVNPAVIELVACDVDTPDESWYVSEHGGGVMIAEPRCMDAYSFQPSNWVKPAN